MAVRALLVLNIALTAACADEGEGRDAVLYYPLAVGDRWVYQEHYENYCSRRQDVAARETIDFGHGKGAREVFVVESRYYEFVPIDAPCNEYLLIDYIEDDGERVVLHRFEFYNHVGDLVFTMDYVPGIRIFDRSKGDAGDQWTTEYTRYADYEEDNSVNEDEVSERTTRFQIVAIDQPVSVPAGDFECLVLQRTDSVGDSATIKNLHFAESIGLVMVTYENGKEDHLESYSLETAEM